MKKTGGLAVGGVQNLAADTGAALQDQFGLNMESLISDTGKQISGLFADYTQRQEEMWSRHRDMGRQMDMLEETAKSAEWF